MKITRKQLRQIIREDLIEERVGGGDAFDEPALEKINPIVKHIANELANRAAELGILDDIHDSGNSADEIFYNLPKKLVLNLPEGDDGTQLAMKISRGHYDPIIEELAYAAPEDGIGLDDSPVIGENKVKITRRQLGQIIKEEISVVLNESYRGQADQAQRMEVAAGLGDGKVDTDDANVLNDIASALQA